MTLLLLTTSPTTLFAQICSSDPTPVIADSGNAWIQDATKLNSALGLSISGNYAYVTSFATNRLTVIDISDPLAPVIANGGNASIQDNAKLSFPIGLAVSGNYAYVGGVGAGSFTVVDISNPLVPVIANGGNAWIQNFSRLNSVWSIAISGNYAYVTALANNAVTVVDISNPLVPVIPNGGNAWVTDATKLNAPIGIAISGNYAYVASATGDSLTVIDISNPLVPVIANSGNAWAQDATKLNGANHVYVDGDYAYVTSGESDSVTVIDISDPLNPVIADSGNDWVTDATKLNASAKISAQGNYLFAIGSSHLTTIDPQCSGSSPKPCDADYEAVMLYNEDEGVLQYCNATDWIDMGPRDNSNGGGSAQAVVATIPGAGAQNGGTTAGVDTTGADLIVLAVTYFAMNPAPTLTDSNGKTADFRQAILLMTSNVGAREMAGRVVGFGDTRAIGLGRGDQAYERAFSPEFRNRLDARLQFAPLSPVVMGQIVDKMIAKSLGSERETIKRGLVAALRRCERRGLLLAARSAKNAWRSARHSGVIIRLTKVSRSRRRPSSNGLVSEWATASTHFSGAGKFFAIAPTVLRANCR